jgi:hypothetical protein
VIKIESPARRLGWIQNHKILYCSNGSHPRWPQYINNKE